MHNPLSLCMLSRLAGSSLYSSTSQPPSGKVSTLNNRALIVFVSCNMVDFHRLQSSLYLWRKQSKNRGEKNTWRLVFGNVISRWKSYNLTLGYTWKINQILFIFYLFMFWRGHRQESNSTNQHLSCTGTAKAAIQTFPNFSFIYLSHKHCRN